MRARESTRKTRPEKAVLPSPKAPPVLEGPGAGRFSKKVRDGMRGRAPSHPSTPDRSRTCNLLIRSRSGRIRGDHVSMSQSVASRVTNRACGRFPTWSLGQEKKGSSAESVGDCAVRCMPRDHYRPNSCDSSEWTRPAILQLPFACRTNAHMSTREADMERLVPRMKWRSGHDMLFGRKNLALSGLP